MQTTQLIVNKNDWNYAKWQTETIDVALIPQTIRLKIALFSFTANNISYALTGNKLGYWQFFPTELVDYGKIPVWGFAEVVESAHENISVGARFYGYYPPADYVVLKADKVRSEGFGDVSPHRLNLPAVYNYYHNIQADALYDKHTEAEQAVFRPLFVTAFLLQDFLAQNRFFEAQNLLLLGASSKTSYLLAFLLQQIAQRQVNIIGLTSAKNQQFVQNLQLYDQVFTYNTISEIPQENTTIIDFSGNKSLHISLEQHLNHKLKYNCLVGASHWGHTQGQGASQHTAKFFFAPQHFQHYIAQHGKAFYQTHLSAQWQALIKHLSPSISIERVRDKELFLERYEQVVTGNYPTEKTLIFEW